MRKLAIFAFSFATAVFAFVYIISITRAHVVLALVLVCGAAAIFLLRGDKRFRAILIAVGLIAGIAWSSLYHVFIYSAAESYDAKEITVTAEVTDYSETMKYGVSLPVKIVTDNGREMKTMLYVYNDEHMEFLPGDKIEFTGKFSISYARDKDDALDQIAKGYLLRASVSDEIELISSPGLTLKYAPRFMAHALAEKIVEIFSKSTEGFALAIVTGNRSLLSEDTELEAAMTSGGVLHIVAVSGMHVVFLAGFVASIVRNKRKAAFASIPIIFLFMAIIGFTPSVTRAGIMQIFVLAAPLLKRESDSITTLSFALLLLLAINPYSAASIALQLSFTSSLGIILFTSRMYTALDTRLGESKAYKIKFVKKAIRFVVGSFSTTFGALALSLPVSVWYFGYISLIAPITNLLILWAAAIAFSLAIIAAVIGFVFAPLGILTAYIASAFFAYITAIVKFLAKFPLAAVYTYNEFIIYWLIYVYLLFIIFIFMRGTLRQIILPCAFSTIMLCVILIGTSVINDNKNMSMTVLDVGQGQSLVITSKTATAVIDCGSSNGDYAGSITADYVKSLGRNKVDLLVLTHYHDDHANGVDDLFAQIEISAMAVPMPSDEDYLSDEIIDSAQKHGVEIIYITRDTSINFGEAKMELYAPLGSEGENEKGLSALCTTDDFDILVTGDMSAEIERILLFAAELPDIETLIVGHHGSKYSTSEELLDVTRPEMAVISVGENRYGHPTKEVLMRLHERNIEIYRTDLHGNVIINAG